MEWKKQGLNLQKIAVNVSAAQFMKSDMVHIVTDILEKTGCKPEHLEIEITESVLLKDKEKILQILKVLSAKGISFAIDDFGTGYSSLSYLKKLPINVIKIDRVFISDIPENRDNVTITKSIIALADSFNCSVIAEGVENRSQIDFLKSNSCNIVQGFLYSKPIDSEEFIHFYKYQNKGK
jgi:EAL domain-containing protein (putative c-di-GMP-specific phosphodiesterase class I)